MVSTRKGTSIVSSAKPFDISKREVWDAYKRVKANRGGAGVDGQSITEFEENLAKNLYKLWNRLASGSYFPPPVRRVDIPKDDGRTRPLGPRGAVKTVQPGAVENRPVVGGHFQNRSVGLPSA